MVGRFASVFRVFVLAVCDVAAGTLAWSGCMKLFQPRTFAMAASVLRIARRRSVATVLARLVGTIEIVLAALVVVVGDPWTFALLAVAFAVFAAVSARAIVVGVESCGCFGQRSVRPTRTHVALDAVVALAAAASVPSAQGLLDRLDPQVPVAAAYIVFLVMGTALLVGALTRVERPVPVSIPRRVARP